MNHEARIESTTDAIRMAQRLLIEAEAHTLLRQYKHTLEDLGRLNDEIHNA